MAQKIILRYRDLQERGHTYSRMHIRRKVANNTFPAPAQLGPNSIGWFLDDIQAYEQRLREERDHRLAAAQANLPERQPEASKRPRGRPRKHPLSDNAPDSTPDSASRVRAPAASTRNGTTSAP